MSESSESSERSGERREHDEPVELTIESLAAGGDGVARDADGRVVFTPGVAPGERVRVRLTEEHRQFARGVLVEVLEASPERVAPPCPLFRDRTCGGCVWQHLSYPAQVAAKQAIVASALRHAIAGGLVLRPCATPADPYRWRRRARLHWVRPARTEAAVIGFYAPRSRRVTRVEACPQIEPALERALEPLHRILAPGLFQRGEIDLLADPDGRVQVAVRGPCRRQAAEALVGQGGVVGVILGRSVFGQRDLELERGEEAGPAGARRGQADRFAQASTAGNRALVAEVAAAVGPTRGARVLELYAGSGNFTRALAAAAAEVVAVDSRPGPRSKDLRVQWEVGPAVEVAGRLLAAERRFDLVVLDPPREGARALCDVIAELAPAPSRLVYVSCDPATLARDLGQLGEHGFRPLTAQPIDLMPQTAHIEVVVTAERS